MKGQYYVYILASHSRVLYVGMTKDLERRVVQHIYGEPQGFTTRYRVNQLVHIEEFCEVSQAIRREKEIKGWRRSKKLALIDAMNPTWRDFAESLPHPHPSG